MTNYRRNFLSGGSFFFTVNLADRRLRLLIEHIHLLRQAFRDVRRRHPFDLDAIVVLPDHLHAIWTLPEDDDDFAVRWRLIKSKFSRGIGTGERISASRAEKKERGIWQRRYWEHTLRDERDFARHADYIHFNPVKHGHVRRVQDWPHSSFHRMVRLGIYPADWGGTAEISRRLRRKMMGFATARVARVGWVERQRNPSCSFPGRMMGSLRSTHPTCATRFNPYRRWSRGG